MLAEAGVTVGVVLPAVALAIAVDEGAAVEAALVGDGLAVAVADASGGSVSSRF